MIKLRLRDMKIFMLLFTPTDDGSDPQIHFFLFQVPCSFFLFSLDSELLDEL